MQRTVSRMFENCRQVATVYVNGRHIQADAAVGGLFDKLHLLPLYCRFVQLPFMYLCTHIFKGLELFLV
jgi:hypothetical protein